MKRETMVWTVILVVAGAFLAINGLSRQAGQQYVAVDEVELVRVVEGATAAEDVWVDADSVEALDYANATDPSTERVSWINQETSTPLEYRNAQAADPTQTKIRFSLSRTIGVWMAGIFSLCIFSFLYKDNPLYKLAESTVVGVSAAYWMVVAFWGTLVPNLFANLHSSLVTGWVMPKAEEKSEMIYLIPLVLGIMLLWRLAPKGGWIARWPMAFIIGVFCGLRFVGFMRADFVSQIDASVTPLLVFAADGNGGMEFMLGDTIRSIVVFLGVLACLVYFFFSIEHKGAVGGVARVGIWFLMITFGAGFGFTVMGRIALLAQRLEFIFIDWLWIIDPNGARAEVETTAMSLLSATGMA